MNPIRLIRYGCGALIVICFFLPWLDLGMMGELMSGMAALAGETVSSTMSGFQLAKGNDLGMEASPLLFAVVVLGVIVCFANKRWAITVCSILAIGLILLFTPGFREGAPEMGQNDWAVGRVLTVISFGIVMVTGFLGKESSQA